MRRYGIRAIVLGQSLGRGGTAVATPSLRGSVARMGVIARNSSCGSPPGRLRRQPYDGVTRLRDSAVHVMERELGRVRPAALHAIMRVDGRADQAGPVLV
jgi:hypothetical protein